jgi:hypothetical protein
MTTSVVAPAGEDQAEASESSTAEAVAPALTADEDWRITVRSNGLNAIPAAGHQPGISDND